MAKREDEKIYESETQQAIQASLNNGATQLLRNNVGAYQRHYRGPFISYGVGGVGGSDLIGWTTLEITEQMVGRRLAVFCALEVKTPDGQATFKQHQFIEKVKRAGGIAGVVRSVDEARELLTTAQPDMCAA